AALLGISRHRARGAAPLARHRHRGPHRHRDPRRRGGDGPRCADPRLLGGDPGGLRGGLRRGAPRGLAPRHGTLSDRDGLDRLPPRAGTASLRSAPAVRPLERGLDGPLPCASPGNGLRRRRPRAKSARGRPAARLSGSLASDGGPQPRDVLRLALRRRGGSEGGEAPLRVRQPAGRPLQVNHLAAGRRLRPRLSTAYPHIVDNSHATTTYSSPRGGWKDQNWYMLTRVKRSTTVFSVRPRL